MKTDMPEPDLSKELIEQLACVPRQIECAFSILPNESAHERPQFRAQRDFGCALLVSLCAQPDRVSGKIYIAQGECGFGEPTTLFPRDFVSNALPFLFSFQHAGDEAVLRYRDLRLRVRLVASDAKLPAWVRLAEARRDGFLDDETEEFYFEQRGIFAGFARIAFRIPAGSPINEITYELPAELPWDGDLLFVKERGQWTPRLLCPESSERAFAVTLRDESRNPCRPQFRMRCRSCIEFQRRQLVAHGERLARFARQVAPEFGRFLNALARGVSVLNPPKARSFFRIDRSHCRAL